MKNPSALLAMIAAAMMVPACSANGDAPPATGNADPLPVLVRNSIRAESSHMALARGELHLDPAGCIRIGDDKGPFVIWHHDSRIERTADGRIKITDGFTGQSAFIGDDVALAGSGGPYAPQNVTPAIPAVCAGGEYWLAGPLQSAPAR